jgi:hypothetical protein
VAVRVCTVAFKDAQGIRHSVDVDADSLYEAVVLGVARLRKEPWLERVNDMTPLEVTVRETAATHFVSLGRVERWIARAAASSTEASRKAKLKMMLVRS